MPIPAEIDPEFEVHLARHRDIVHEGKRRVNRPVGAVILGSMALAFVCLRGFGETGAFGALGLFWGGIGTAWLLHARLIKRWYRWAVAQEIDTDLLQELAVEANLMWRANSFFGRREAPTWRAIEAEQGEATRALSQ